MTACMIRIVGSAVPGARTKLDGAWLRSCDVDAFGGFGEVLGTPNPRRAMRFATPAHALAYYRRQSSVRPLRDDRKPNRPLTAFTVEIVPVPSEVQA